MNIFQTIVDICNHPLIIIGGAISLAITLGTLLLIAISWILGLRVPLVRLGLGLRKRHLAILSSPENFQPLKELLVDSKLFRERNIINLRSDNLDKAKTYSLFLVDWQTMGGEIGKIFGARSHDQVPVIIYSKPGSIPPDTMNDIANRANTVVVNFRGRLINDVLTSLMTTTD